MKRIALFLMAFVVMSLQSCKKDVEQKDLGTTIRVAVFQGHGGAETCVWETLEAVKIDPEMDVRLVSTSDIANGILEDMDALIIPGGGGSRQYLNLGVENHKRIKEFIERGGGVVGICAGAYLFSETPNYACLKLNKAKAIDIEHDNRGHGIVKVTLNEEGEAIFPEVADRDTLYIMYYEGPVFVPVNDSEEPAYNTLAIMESDVHEEGGAPADMTNNKPFFITTTLGDGRIFSSIAHPEGTPGMRWMIPRMVRWAVKAPYITYSSQVVRPDIYNREILMTVADLRQESNYYQTFLYGTASEKIEALDWLESHASWSAKRWIQGLLFDADPEVRIRAAQYIANTEYTHYLKDVEVAVQVERDKKVRSELNKQLQLLKDQLPIR